MTRDQSWLPSVEQTLPEDRERAVLVGRIHDPAVGGPSVVVVRGDELVDITAHVPTVRDLAEVEDPAELVRRCDGPVVAHLADVLGTDGSASDREDLPRLLSPIDLQAVKASGVTFAVSMLERVIEERASGDPQEAVQLRAELSRTVPGDLAEVRPGSAEAARVKELLVASGSWSQYLEVGLGPHAEIFTKTAPMATIGTAADIGVRPDSTWNNPEPEAVLLIASDGRVVGATLGNDVNLRDFEGRSALLLGEAKDNNASAAVGPFVRLFDESFGLDDVRSMDIDLRISGQDAFDLRATSSMSMISRDPQDLVNQLIGETHQYPDGVVLYLGTMFAPIEDRDEPGQGFTHHLDDVVTITSPQLGALVNRVRTSDQCPPWTFGTAALFRSLAERELL